MKGTFGVRLGGDAHTDEIRQLDQGIPRKFTLRSDHPSALLGENTGPPAVELLLCGLGACVMATYAAHATARGIRIDGLEVALDGAVDLNGFLQLKPTRAGLSHVQVILHVKSDASQRELDELLDVTRRASPVYDSVSQPVTIEAAVQRVA